jgi:hypothetical protein
VVLDFVLHFGLLLFLAFDLQALEGDGERFTAGVEDRDADLHFVRKGKSARLKVVPTSFSFLTTRRVDHLGSPFDPQVR